ncbi:Serine--tRNA synthetase-like protein Slimp [Frankliniella fusca]|uniref:serine--tRNA ligase n=1 Tax=Frankliniella fusca TaxID=407009 RepID=A0AAE1HI03_9NEOP|nr:Serine--tRNA synthetase-like protein Slimp [Frankliniella fusca]
MFSQSAKLLPVTRCVQYTAAEKCRRGCTSSLYITGDRGTESCIILSPYVNLNRRFEDTEALVKNVQSRGLNVDIPQLKSSWEQYQNLSKFKLQLDSEKSGSFAKLNAAKALHKPKVLNELKADYNAIKERLSSVKKELWDVERKAILGGLSLPNDIHPDTPSNNESEKIVHEFGQKPAVSDSCPSHLEVANKLGLIEYYDSSYYFLIDDAARFEMGISYFFQDKLKEIGYITMSNSDFGKSVVVEGVGLDPRDASSVFTLERDSDSKDPTARLHLVGGASLVSFSAFHTKTATNIKHLPLRYVAIGRHYNPDNNKGLHGLFSTWQSSAVETFVLAADKNMAMEEFKLCLKEIIDLYETLGYHFRVEYLPPASLKPWESLRASIQMFSKNMVKYIEVGSLSLCDDFISQRLLMCCEPASGKSLQFAHVISGTVVSVPRILGCVLEYNADSFELPPQVSAAIL